jgi:hypothetical protein
MNFSLVVSQYLEKEKKTWADTETDNGKKMFVR